MSVSAGPDEIQPTRRSWRSIWLTVATVAVVFVGVVGGSLWLGNGRSPAAPTDVTHPPATDRDSLTIATELPLPKGEPPACLLAALGPVRVAVSGNRLVVVDVYTGRASDVVWPYGFSARLVDGKAVLLAADGSVVAGEGDVLRLGGGGGGTTFHICQIDDTIYVDGKTYKP